MRKKIYVVTAIAFISYFLITMYSGRDNGSLNAEIIKENQLIESVEPQTVVIENIASMSLAFTENKGQWDSRVMFKADAGGAAMWFTRDGVYYQFTRYIPKDEEALDKAVHPGIDRPDIETEEIEAMLISASFVGANPGPQVTGREMMEYKCNYFLGNDPENWHTNVPNYEAVIYKEIYPGIDLKYYGNSEKMEYDFVVSPEADPSVIRIKYEGVESLSVNDSGQLVVETEWNTITEMRPRAYQIEGRQVNEVECEYFLLAGNEFGFYLTGDYNPALPLTIDPVLSYSTYLGGSQPDTGIDIAVDADGYAYVTGLTWSSNFPMEGPYQGIFQGDKDSFVTKLSASGDSLIYSTYLGGADYDIGRGIAVDADGHAYVTGWTDSANFPTVNPFQTDQGDTDVFVTKLSASGDSLEYSTYLGGSTSERGSDIAVDAYGHAYVTGSTNSTDFPTVNPFQTFQGGTDVFVTKLGISGNSLEYSTYLGGSWSDYSYPGIAVDANGFAYVAGSTLSTDFPTENPYQTDQEGWDAFVTKLSASGDSLEYSTYLGGAGVDSGRNIAVDAYGHAYVTGVTDSTDFPTENPIQTCQGEGDAFVTKLSASGNSLEYSTYLGGAGGDSGGDIAADADGYAYVTGSTESTDFPTENPIQTDQEYTDAFVTKLSASGDSLEYSTYLGGVGYDYGHGIAIDADSNAFVTGSTPSYDFPTVNPYQPSLRGSSDAFVVKFSEIELICGDMDESGGIDIADLVYIVDYMFNQGPEPVPDLCVANVDGIGQIDIADLVYLVDYMFNQGPEPVSTCCD